MKRPMCILAVSWLAGMLLAGYGPDIGTGIVLFIYFILIIFGLLVLKKHPHVLNSHVQIEWYPQLTVLLFLIPLLFLIGFWRSESFMEKQAMQEQSWKLLYEQEESYVTVEGIVKSRSAEERVTLELTECVIIGYYGEENQPAGDCRVVIEAEGKAWLPKSFTGNRIRVFGKFSTFLPATNPGQFDAREYYAGKKLFADVSALRITVLEDEISPIGHGILLLKQRLKENIATLYPEEKAGVLTAMILGDKDLLPEELETLFRQAGISHILAISGLHISLLCMGLFRALRKLTVSQKAATVTAIGFLVFYLMLTGASTSSLRAGIMCVVMLGAGWFRRSYDLLSSLALAAICVTALRPEELASAGFLLSFGAVLGVAMAQEMEYVILKNYEGKRPWWCLFLYGGMIQCVTAPVSLWFFYEMSPYSILLNLVVIPLVSLILGGGIASAVFGMFWPLAAKLPVGGTYFLLEFYEWLCEKTQKLPFSFVLLGRPEAWKLAVYYCVLITAFFVFFRKMGGFRQNKGKEILLKGAKPDGNGVCILLLGIVCSVAILCVPGKQSTKIIYLDVSQGDSALITTAEGTVILSDCGSSDISRVGEYRLFPALKQEGILLVDMAVVSHLDSDHTSGIKELLKTMPVYTGDTEFAVGYAGACGIKELCLPRVTEKSEAYIELENLAKSRQVKVRYIQAGEVLYQEENLLIECIFPRDARVSENETSLVFLLQTPKLLAWLMGDAGTASEEEIMKWLAAVDMEALSGEKLVLLKAGHHGSKTSSGTEFLSFVQPDVSVISCGYRNTYGHPHREVVEGLLAGGSEVFRTDLQGAIVVEFGLFGDPKVHSWREIVRE